MQPRKNGLQKIDFTIVKTQNCLLEPSGDDNRTQAQLAQMQYFMIRVANFWVKIQSFCAHWT